MGSEVTFPQLHDVEWLREQYVDKHLTGKQIAALIGCSVPRVYQVLNASGISTQRTHSKIRSDYVPDDVLVGWLERYYRETGSVRVSTNYQRWQSRTPGAPTWATLHARGLRSYLRQTHGNDPQVDEMPTFHWRPVDAVGWLYSNTTGTATEIADACGVHMVTVRRRHPAKPAHPGPQPAEVTGTPRSGGNAWKAKATRRADGANVITMWDNTGRKKRVTVTDAQAAVLRAALARGA